MGKVNPDVIEHLISTNEVTLKEVRLKRPQRPKLADPKVPGGILQAGSAQMHHSNTVSQGNQELHSVESLRGDALVTNPRVSGCRRCTLGVANRSRMTGDMKRFPVLKSIGLIPQRTAQVTAFLSSRHFELDIQGNTIFSRTS